MALSKLAIVRPIGDLTANHSASFKYDLTSLVALCIALYESIDIQGSPQLAVFVHYVSKHLCVEEELLDLVAFKDTTNGVYVQNGIDSVLS